MLRPEVHDLSMAPDGAFKRAGIHPYQATLEDLQNLTAIIETVWQHIMNLSFPNTDNYPAGMEGIQKFMADLLGAKI